MADHLLTVLTVAGALGSGMVAGVLLAFSTLVMAGLRELPAAQGIHAMQRINRSAPRPLFMLAFVGSGVVCAVLLVQALTALDRPGAISRLIGRIPSSIVGGRWHPELVTEMHPAPSYP